MRRTPPCPAHLLFLQKTREPRSQSEESLLKDNNTDRVDPNLEIIRRLRKIFFPSVGILFWGRKMKHSRVSSSGSSAAILWRPWVVLESVSTIALLVASSAPASAASLPSTYSPAVNNGGGASPGRADIVTLNGTTDVIQGDYNLLGTSGRRFQFNSATIATRNAQGEVLSGYADVNGQVSLALGTQQKTRAVTYPDAIKGTNAATLVYDNNALQELPTVNTKVLTVSDTGAAVYGDLRIADIGSSSVTIATGDKTKSIYDPANFAILTADSGSTLYNVTSSSNIVYDARTATMDGADQDKLAQAANVTVQAPVTTYSGLTFGNADAVTDLASLKRYNDYLIGLLTTGAITPTQYESRMQAAVSTTTRPVTVSTPLITPYMAPATTSDRIFLRLDGSKLTTTADSMLVGVTVADGNSDGITTLISARNGSTILNNGIIAQGEGGPGIRLKDVGTSLTNFETGVIGVGYETLDRSAGTPVPTGISDYRGEGTGNEAIRASDGATVINRGIVNVANLDIAGHDEDPSFGKANDGIVTLSGASSVNAGTILIGGAGSAVANTRGLYAGAAGMVAYNGGTATNAEGGTIRIGTSFAETSADLASVADVVSTNYAAGMVSLSGGGNIVNDGLIRIGSLAQNATGMMVAGDGNVATNNGTIAIDPTGLSIPSARNVALWARGGASAGTVSAVNAASGLIEVGGVNGAGLLVENEAAGGSARGVNDGRIVVEGGLSPDHLRNYGIFVGNAASSAVQNGAIALVGDGAIGVHARNGGKIEVGSSATLDFQGNGQIGYYTLGAGSTINIDATAITDVATANSTGFRAEGGATVVGKNLQLLVSGSNAIGIVGSGASAGTTIDASGARIDIAGEGSTGLLIEGGATGVLAASSAIGLTGSGATGAIVDGQGHSLDGAAAGTPVGTTGLVSAANLVSTSDGLTGYVARNGAKLTNIGNIAFAGREGVGIAVSTGATATNTGMLTVGAGGTGIRLRSTGADDVVTANEAGVIVAKDGSTSARTRAVQADGAGAVANLRSGTSLVLDGNGAIGAEAIHGGSVNLGLNTKVPFSATAGDQIALHAAGAGSTISGLPEALDATGTRSTLLRYDDGATGRFAVPLTLGASGAGSTAITAAGSGTTLDVTDIAFLVSGQAASAVKVFGGASATLGNSTTVQLGSNGFGAIVDGRTSLLDGSFGSPLAATLSSTATISGAGDRATAYAVREGGALDHGGTILLDGVGAVGIQVDGRGSTVRHSGTIRLNGQGGVGALVSGGGSFNDAGSIDVAAGTGVIIDGVGSSLATSADSMISVSDGIAALRLANGGSYDGAVNLAAAGTAHGVLVDTGAGPLTLGTSRIIVGGSGNGIENVADQGSIRLNGTSITVNGTGAGLRTQVAIDPASTATIVAAGVGSTGISFAAAAGRTTANDLTLGNGLAISATGVGATGIRLGTTGVVGLATRVNVAAINGGSALIGGPARTIVNSGSLISASTSAPVVDLRGGTGAFENKGTIAAPSPKGAAILGGENGQTVTLSGGSVTGAVVLGSGADTFLMTGGTMSGALDTGSGSDSATFRGLTDTNMAGITEIAARGLSATNRLSFDGTISTGTRRLTGWNTVDLVNRSTLTADGDFTVSGSMTIDAGSTLFAGNGVRAVVAPAAGRKLALHNGGTIDLTNGSSGTGDQLVIRGDYEGRNGTLKLDTALGGDGSPSDRLIIDGGKVSGTTTIMIANAGGLGAATTGDGIELVSAINGGTTTATTSRDGFVLAGSHIDAGAYQYRLYASNLAGTGESWYLRTQVLNQEAQGGDEPTPIYRVEVPLLAALPDRLRRGDLAMVGTYHQRMGDEDAQVAQGFTFPGRTWGRFILDDARFAQNGDAHPVTDGRIYGYQVGVDIFRYGTTGGGHHDVGIYGGYTHGRAQVTGSALGLTAQHAGTLAPNATYAGLYWTYLSGGGFYVDTVLQHSWYGGHAGAQSGNRIGINGTSMLASVETGYGLALSPTWTIEPQAQIIMQGLSIDDVAIPNASVSQRDRGTFTGRLGLRLKGRFETQSGSLQPYLRANLWRGFASTDRTLFITPAATSVIRTDTSFFRGEAGAGLSWRLAPTLTVYGEGDHSFSLDHGRSRAGHSTRGSIGIKASF